MTVITDDRLDLELTGFLHAHAEELYGAPDASEMTWRIASRAASFRDRFERVIARPALRFALVALLVAVAMGAMAVGATHQGPTGNGLIVLGTSTFIDPLTGDYVIRAPCGGRCEDIFANEGIWGEVGWSRDGREIVFVDPDGLAGVAVTGGSGQSLWRYDSSDDRLSMIAACKPEDRDLERFPPRCYGPSLSRDGRSIAFIEDEIADPRDPTTWTWSLVVTDSESTARRQVFPIPGVAHGTEFLGDGRVAVGMHPPNVAQDVDTTSVILVDPTTGQLTEPVRPRQHAYAAVSPDGARIAYVGYGHEVVRDGIWRPEDNVPEVWLASVDGTGLRLIHRGSPTTDLNPPYWSPDGNGLAITGIGILDIPSGTIRPLPPGPVVGWISSG